MISTIKAGVVNSNPTLAWGQTSQVGTVDGRPLQVTMPANPVAPYYAGTAIDITNDVISVEPIFKILTYQVSYSLASGSGQSFTGQDLGVDPPAGYTAIALRTAHTQTSWVVVTTFNANSANAGQTGSLVITIRNFGTNTEAHTLTVSILYVLSGLIET